MPTNFYMFFLAAFIPMIVGFVYYHEKTVGSAWMKVNGFKSEDLEGGNMALTMGLAYLCSCFVAFALQQVVIHQAGAFGMMAPEIFESGSAAQKEFTELMTRYGNNGRDFGHGALHGAFFTVFFVAPLISINALFEQRGGKYILIHSVYWLITLTLMGGLICATLEYPPLS